MWYIKSKNIMLNPAHIIKALFEPEYLEPERESDYYPGKIIPEHMEPARLTMWLAALELTQAYRYEDNVSGTASQSVKQILTGKDAENMWANMEASASRII